MSGHSRAPIVPSAAVASWRERMSAWLSRQSQSDSLVRRSLETLEDRLRQINLSLESVYGTPHLGGGPGGPGSLV